MFSINIIAPTVTWKQLASGYLNWKGSDEIVGDGQINQTTITRECMVSATVRSLFFPLPLHVYCLGWACLVLVVEKNSSQLWFLVSFYLQLKFIMCLIFKKNRLSNLLLLDDNWRHDEIYVSIDPLASKKQYNNLGKIASLRRSIYICFCKK